MHSLQTFTRAIMGLASTAKPEELPTLASADEKASWANWREQSKEAIKQKLQEKSEKHPNANQQELELIRKDTLEGLKARLKGVTFRGAPLISASAVSIHVKRDVEADLAKHGFHRFTFDWNTPSARDCLWNMLTVDIIMRHWLPWAKQMQVEVLEDALLGIKKGGPNSGSCCINQKAHSVCQNNQEEEIANLHADTFLELYPSKKILAHLLQDPDAVSDFDKESPNALPQRIKTIWRSDFAKNIIRCLDRVALHRAKMPQKKMSVRGLLERDSTRDRTEEEAEVQLVPQRFPRDGYSPKYLEAVGDFQAEHLSSEAMGLKDLLTKMVSKTYRKNGGTGDNNALVVAEAGPSTSTSPEVQMSI
ncbi:uncharacterized protein VP01_5070g2 [Puccinia sorghi]|uniref:Uncharacterized protein n=1 Tax=Puccinia sorghi TaxID=27349 RepID=A0A0L6UNH2_9BASI|nr:uncharacterized protein VP01_5070g2 [Puccinia sorghi]